MIKLFIVVFLQGWSEADLESPSSWIIDSSPSSDMFRSFDSSCKSNHRTLFFVFSSDILYHTLVLEQLLYSLPARLNQCKNASSLWAWSNKSPLSTCQLCFTRSHCLLTVSAVFGVPLPPVHLSPLILVRASWLVALPSPIRPACVDSWAMVQEQFLL